MLQGGNCEGVRALTGSATVRAPGVCGELVQGMLGDAHFLVTCPIDLFSEVRVTLHHGGPGVEAPADCPKSAAALTATLAHLGRADLGARLSVRSAIPRSKGMGSSSADVAATIAAAGLALGTKLLPDLVARIAASVEPTDGIMFPGIALMDHREGRILEALGPPPPMEIIALDFGGTVDTVEFNSVDRRSVWRSIGTEVDRALELVKDGLRRGDPGTIGEGATISARASQRVSPKPRMPAVLEFAGAAGAVGVNVGHSGTIIGVLLDAGARQGEAVLQQARQAFPDAKAIHRFRLTGGGLQQLR
ncbi:MAG: GHMP kinase [Dehalococcoidia bacterium]|nr:GHMP kinase [Dehalococcoidia bacterium]MDP7201824.1 GHMP kinase [Dehalococcoidia bacterium]